VIKPHPILLHERWGNDDVLHCPYCHGYEVRDAPIGVLGGDNRPFTLHQASLVRQWSSDVVFPEPDHPRCRGLTALGCEVGENGWVVTGAMGRTSVPGVWAAGNVVAEGAQAINAGSVAAIGLNHYLLAQDVEQAVADHRAVRGAFTAERE
jgi:thioredoxin reductase (NADPH)